MRRIAATLAALAVLAAPAAAHAKASWAKPQIKAVVAQGLMAPTVKEFRPDDPLLRSELDQVLAALTGEVRTLAEPERPVSVAELDADLVRMLGLGLDADLIQGQVAAAGLEPPERLGTETIARLLGLRKNHPATEDSRELGPDAPVTRAEAAFSLARALKLRDADLLWVDELAASFVMPALSDWQRRILSLAVQFVGYPYVWGGYSELEQAPFGVTVPGGFDCSGLVWRVYKTEPFPEAPFLAELLQARSTYEMSRERKRRERIPLAEIQPGDILFFGPHGPKSKPSQVGHVAVYLGGGWLVHSSRFGTTLHPLKDWYETSFAWGRRPLAEAGLS